MKLFLGAVLAVTLMILGCKKDKAPVPRERDHAYEDLAKTATEEYTGDYRSGIAECDALLTRVKACEHLGPSAKRSLLATTMLASELKKDAPEEQKAKQAKDCAENSKLSDEDFKQAGCN